MNILDIFEFQLAKFRFGDFRSVGMMLSNPPHETYCVSVSTVIFINKSMAPQQESNDACEIEVLYLLSHSCYEKKTVTIKKNLIIFNKYKF